MIRQFETPPPNLFEGRVPRFGSKGWIPRSTAGRVGALIIGTLYVAAGLLAVVATLKLKNEIRNSISSPVVGIVSSILAVAAVLAISSGVIFLGSRIVVSAFRKDPRSNHSLR